jgi:hypothetical protein
MGFSTGAENVGMPIDAFFIAYNESGVSISAYCSNKGYFNKIAG